MHTTLIAALLAASTLQTEQTVDAPEVVRVDTPRLRMGIGYWATYGTYPASSAGIIGVSAHVGVQVNDHLAFYLLGEASNLVITGAFVSGLMAEFSPLDWLSVAAGPGVSGSFFWTTSFFSGETRTDKSLSLGAPLRLTFNLGAKELENPHRNRMYIAVDGFVGARIADTGTSYLSGSPVAASIGIGLGWQLM